MEIALEPYFLSNAASLLIPQKQLENDLLRIAFA